jgi:hypothetical protein
MSGTLSQPVPTTVGSAPPSDAGGPDRPRSWGSRAVAVIGLLALAVPVVAYFWFINRYALDVLYYDSWSNIYLIWHPFNLWDQHNENRTFFPNIIVVLLGYTTHFNVVAEEFLGGVMLVAATGLLIAAHKCRSPSTPWLFYCPVALVMLSFVQAGNTLWGFQMAWYLVMLALAASVFLLDRPHLTRLVLAAAIVAAVVGSYSSLQGLLIWPVGLVLIWRRRRSRRVAAIWIGSAVVTTALYFFHFNYSQTYSDKSYLFSHPIAALKLFFFVLGNVFGAKVFDNTGTHIPNAPDAAMGVVIALGVVVFAVATWVVIVYGLRGDDAGGSPIGVAMVCFGVLFALSTALGRISPIPTDLIGGPSRYTTFPLLVIAGSYLALRHRPPPRAGRSPALADQPGQVVAVPGGTTAWLIRASYPVVLAVVIGAVGLSVVLGTRVGLDYGRYWHQREVVMADITANLPEVPDSLIDTDLFPNGARWVRPWAKWAAAHDLSPVASGAVTYYAKVGLLPELTAVHTSLYWPRAGVILRGTVHLYAAASAPIGIDKVEFRITGGGLHTSTVVTATLVHSVWVADWDSANVANGAYGIRSVAATSSGTTGSSATVGMTVDN